MARYFYVLGLLAICSSCSILPFKKEPEVQVVTEQVLYTVQQVEFQRPQPFDIPTAEWLVVIPGDKRLEAAEALICLTTSGYAAIAKNYEEMVLWMIDANAVLDQYEAAVKRNNSMNNSDSFPQPK